MTGLFEISSVYLNSVAETGSIAKMKEPIH